LPARGAIPTGTRPAVRAEVGRVPDLICTHERFLARSRRGWDMSRLLPELADELPPDVQLDGEMVAGRR
jgi:hypothetical protein